MAGRLHITSDLARASYERLRMTAPFNRWPLPHGDKIAFHITGDEDRYGHFVECRRWHFMRIGVSAVNVKNLHDLDMLLAHEMIHLYLHLRKFKGKDHGKTFMMYARRICRTHGWKLEDF